MDKEEKQEEAHLSDKKTTNDIGQKGGKSQAAGSEVAGGENVEKIRDILFGAQMRDYEKRFGHMEDRMLKEIANLKHENKMRFESIETYIKKEVESLIDRVKVEQDQRAESLKELSRELKELSKSLEKRITQGDELLSKNSRALREQILDQSKLLSDEILHKSEEFTKALEQAARELRSDKVDRAVLSDLLMELAMRVTNEDAMKLGLKSKD